MSNIKPHVILKEYLNTQGYKEIHWKNHRKAVPGEYYQYQYKHWNTEIIISDKDYLTLVTDNPETPAMIYVSPTDWVIDEIEISFIEIDKLKPYLNGMWYAAKRIERIANEY